MGSQVLTATLEEALCLGPEALFLDHKMLVVTGIEWAADMKALRSGLVKKRRDFKGPFRESEPAKPVRKELRRLGLHMDRVFKQFYPRFAPIETRASWRPMITGPEPLHFDTYEGATMVTSFINVSKTARKYCVGPSFADLVRDCPEMLREIAATGDRNGDLSYAIRQRTAEGLPPLGADTPREHVDMPPGSIWFFNAKTVSHEVVYGEGAFSLSWDVPRCGAATQADLLKEVL